VTSPQRKDPDILCDVASIKRSSEMQVVSHTNPSGRRCLRSVQERDLGAVPVNVQRSVDKDRKLDCRRGSVVTLRGKVDTMRNSYASLLGGLAFSIVLRLPADRGHFSIMAGPFIIVTALPAAASRP